MMNVLDHDYTGEMVLFDGEPYYVDMTDAESDDIEEVSFFLLPIEYQDAEKYKELYRSGHIDDVGFWCYASYCTEV